MRQILLGLMTVAIFSFALVAFVVGLSFYQDYTTQEYVNQYYDDIISGDYEKAFEHVHSWSGDPEKDFTMSDGAARDLYLKKVSRLRDEGYQLVSVDNIVIIEDGPNLGAKVSITISIKGEKKKVEELLHFYNTKIVIVKSQDPYYHLRDCRVDG